MRKEFERLSLRVPHYIICSLMAIVIETDNVVRFASQRANDYQ
jgi:hypothetical protein